MDEKFNMFMETVDDRFRSFVNQINEYLIENGCKCDISRKRLSVNGLSIPMIVIRNV